MQCTRRILISLLVVSATVTLAAAVQKMSVQVRSGQIRTSPSYLASVESSVAYGDRLTVVEMQGAWAHVEDARGHGGWIHESALTKKQVVLQSGAANVEATAGEDEVALAGKGFSQAVEREFKTQHTELDYTWIDRMEKVNVSPERIVAFLKEGAVVPRGGAR